MDIFDAMAAGKVPPPPPSRTADDGALTEAELACSYKLARHVPDMARGFTICTNYGEMRIGGPLALRMQALVRQALANELAALGNRRK